MRQSIWKYPWTPACDSQFENTLGHPRATINFENSPGPPRATVNLKILLDNRVQQWIRKSSWTPACDSEQENAQKALVCSTWYVRVGDSNRAVKMTVSWRHYGKMLRWTHSFLQSTTRSGKNKHSCLVLTSVGCPPCYFIFWNIFNQKIENSNYFFSPDPCFAKGWYANEMWLPRAYIFLLKIFARYRLDLWDIAEIWLFENIPQNIDLISSVQGLSCVHVCSATLR